MKHGANIYKYAKKLQCSLDEILDFSSNINSYHPKIKIKPTNKMLVKYADTSYATLRNAISKKYTLTKKQIALFNGATSAIYSLFQSLNHKSVYLYAPLYGEYEKAIAKGVTIVTINRLKHLYTQPKKGSTVVFVNPSTPDGKYYDLQKLFSLWKKQNCTIIIDESFLEFQNLKSLRNQINTYNKLYIVQSFSKFNSCAGVRIGAIFSTKDNIKKLSSPIWNLSSFDAEFLRQRLQDKKFISKTKTFHKKNKKQLLNILQNSQLFDKIYPSDANFFLTKSSKAKKIFKHLLHHKILVRTCGSFDFLNDKYLRFGVKNDAMHKKLKKALNELS